jgi:MSHA biogenesis protein MshG
MPVYMYKGRNARGDLMEGRIESPNAHAVAIWMTTVGITPVTISEARAAGTTPKWLTDLFGQAKLDEMELLLFTRQMGALVRAGVPMMQALSSLQKSTRKQHLLSMLSTIRDDLDRGLELSAALARHPASFNEFYVSMVKVGESSGQLETVFRRLHEQIEFDMDMRRKLKAALRYPTFVIIALAIALSIINIWVIPTFASVYQQMGVSLPFITRALIGFSTLTVQYWWVLVGIAFVAVIAVRIYYKSAEGRRNLDELKLRIPIFGPILNKGAMARYAFSFATASEAGIPLVQTYTLTSKVVGNAHFERKIIQMREGVERGESIFRTAQNAGIFSPLELQMLSVGEETGRMDEMLRSISQMYQEEVDFEVTRLAQTLEPILITGLGVIVAILMLGVFLPMWDLAQLARRR